MKYTSLRENANNVLELRTSFILRIGITGTSTSFRDVASTNFVRNHVVCHELAAMFALTIRQPTVVCERKRTECNICPCVAVYALSILTGQEYSAVVSGWIVATRTKTCQNDTYVIHLQVHDPCPENKTAVLHVASKKAFLNLFMAIFRYNSHYFILP